MNLVMRLIAVAVALGLALVPGSATAAGKADRVGDFRAKAMKVRVDKASGPHVWRGVTQRTKVFLVDRTGNRRAASLDELVRGARVVGSRVGGGTVKAITLAERAATGAADCSFDSDDGDDDSVTDDDSFECEHDYDDGRLDTDSDCSYDSSREGTTNDWSLDTSWDCSYSEDVDGPADDDGVDWDCSFSASAGGSRDADGGDVDADLDFDCSWSGADTDSALWDCSFLRGVMGFRCVSLQLDQEFEYVVDVEDMAIEGGLEFQRDRFDDPLTSDGVDCSGNAADGYDCSLDGEWGSGDCGTDWSFDRSRGVREGDVSGSLSYSCSWDR